LAVVILTCGFLALVIGWIFVVPIVHVHSRPARDGLPRVGNAEETFNARTLLNSDQVDLGFVKAGSIRDCLFSITNDSSDPWKIAAVRSSCKCTVATISKDTILPGEFATISARYKAPSIARDDLTQVSVSFNGNNVAEIPLKVRARVRTPLTILPDEINLGHVTASSEREFDFLVENHSEQDLSFLDFSDNSFFRFSATPVSCSDAEGSQGLRQRWHVQGKLTPANLSNRLETAVFRVSSPERLVEGKFVVSWQQRGSVSIVPRQWIVGEIECGGVSETTITLICDSEKSANICVNPTASWIKSEWLSRTPKFAVLKLRLEMPTEIKVGRYDREVQLLTAGRVEGVIPVRVTILNQLRSESANSKTRPVESGLGNMNSEAVE